MQLTPGVNVQSLVNSNAPGTSYCFAAGTYARQSISPQTGDAYTGQMGAILDGQGAVGYAFHSAAKNVIIQNLVIQNYAPALQVAEVSNREGGGVNWLIRNNEITGSAGAGVGVGDGTQVTSNYIHDNVQQGYTCTGVGVVFTDNEIAFNNPRGAVNPNWEAGAGKCYQSTNLVMKYNYSHDNHGPGLWTDTNNQGVDYEYNDVENNWMGGIFHEISWDGIIANNVVKNNANTRYCHGWMWCSEIMISTSGGVNGKTMDIYNNTVVSNGAQHGNGIGLVEQQRGSGPYGTYRVCNVHVYNNNVDMSQGGMSGGATDHDNTAMFTSRCNSFDSNVYTGAGSGSFSWNGQLGNFSYFQSQGEELNGTSQ